jgi:hypothetical protein
VFTYLSSQTFVVFFSSFSVVCLASVVAVIIVGVVVVAVIIAVVVVVVMARIGLRCCLSPCFACSCYCFLAFYSDLSDLLLCMSLD